MKESQINADNTVFSWLIQKNDLNALSRFYMNGGTLTIEQFRTLACLYNLKELRQVWKILVPCISSVDWTTALFDEIKKVLGVNYSKELYDKTAIPMNIMG